jgi:hypothetical protein
MLILCRRKGEYHFRKKYEVTSTKANPDNTIEQEINERIATGNKAFAAHLTLFKSKLISKTAKLRLHQMVIRPTVTYACETWTLKEATKHRKENFKKDFWAIRKP